MLHKIARVVITNHVKSEGAKAGPLGMLAGLAVGTVMRRSVPGAIIIGGVMVARQLLKIKRNVNAKRAADVKAAVKDADSAPDPS
ncbi:hypothetical protein [Rhizorhapis sp. SPR117]|uniref:hypothetical protein n=1 Tax=Rhizorhapis sp. SPR117 TaxID=2912611 RepID=UPI001F370B4E|nr:hypothetical protein [Rhizorhapis sp. SPR117]